jgi:spoIIIJ-associated protein
MSKKRATLEVIAPTIEEAVEKGLSELGLPEEAVDIEVLDEGSKGLFGLGSRQARVRLSIKGAVPTDEVETVEELVEEEESSGYFDEDEEAYEELVVKEKTPPAEIKFEGLEEHILDVAEDTVSELLFKMHVRADVSAKFGEPDEVRGRTPILVDITGTDLSILIGRQAETLNALQYIAGLIVSKEIGRNLTIVIDVQGYRKRREQQLRQLARRMADQAMKTGRRQILEPMPANERRIIHIELRDHPQVSTESIGEEPRRKVTILPK